MHFNVIMSKMKHAIMLAAGLLATSFSLMLASSSLCSVLNSCKLQMDCWEQTTVLALISLFARAADEINLGWKNTKLGLKLGTFSLSSILTFRPLKKIW